MPLSFNKIRKICPQHYLCHPFIVWDNPSNHTLDSRLPTCSVRGYGCFSLGSSTAIRMYVQGQEFWLFYCHCRYTPARGTQCWKRCLKSSF